jgi:hypothetical protein
MAFPVGINVTRDWICVIFIITCVSEPFSAGSADGFVPAPEGRKVWDMDGIITCKENKITRRKLAPVALPTADYTYKRSKLGLCKGKPMNNGLSYGTALPALNWSNPCKYCSRFALQNDINQLYQFQQPETDRIASFTEAGEKHREN